MKEQGEGSRHYDLAVEAAELKAPKFNRHLDRSKKGLKGPANPLVWDRRRPVAEGKHVINQAVEATKAAPKKAVAAGVLASQLSAVMPAAAETPQLPAVVQEIEIEAAPMVDVLSLDSTFSEAFRAESSNQTEVTEAEVEEPRLSYELDDNGQHRFKLIVKSGDTLSSVARTTNVTVDQLVKDNDISDPDLILVGQEIDIIVEKPLIRTLPKGKTISHFSDSFGGLVSSVDLASINDIDLGQGDERRLAVGTPILLPIETAERRVYVVEAGDKPWQVAQRLGFDSVDDFIAVNGVLDNSLGNPIIYPDLRYFGPAVPVIEPAVTTQVEERQPPAGQSDEILPSPDEPEVQLPDEEPRSEPPIISDPKPEAPEPKPEDEAVVALKAHYNAMNRWCGDTIPNGDDKQNSQPDQFEKLQARYELAKEQGELGEFLLDLRNNQLKYLAQQLGTDYKGAVAHCISGIASETGIDWSYLSKSQQNQWLKIKAELIQDVAEGASLHGVEDLIEEAKYLVTDVHNKLVQTGSVPELRIGLSDELAAARAIRYMTEGNLRAILIDEVKWVVEQRDNGTTVNGLLGRALMARLNQDFDQLKVEPSNKQLQTIGRRYVEADFNFETIAGEFKRERANVIDLYELMQLDAPSADRTDELALDLLAGRSLEDLRQGLAAYRAEAENTGLKDVYFDVLVSNIENEEIKNDEELIKDLAKNLAATHDGQEIAISVGSILEAAENGDIDALNGMAEQYMPFAKTGKEIINGFTEKYGKGNSGKLHESELTKLGSHWGNHSLHHDAARAFLMLNEAYEHHFGQPIAMTDSYRTFDQQVITKDEKGRWAAEPGFSIHGWGGALDLGGGINNFGTPEHKWMRQHAPNYGWILPEWAHDGEGIEEPWHWEYRGRPSESPVTNEPETNTGAIFDFPDSLSEATRRFGHEAGLFYNDDDTLLLSKFDQYFEQTLTWEQAAKQDWREHDLERMPLLDVAAVLGAAGFVNESPEVWAEATALTVSISSGVLENNEFWVPVFHAMPDGDDERACFTGRPLDSVSDPKKKIDLFEDCAKALYNQYKRDGFEAIPEYKLQKYLPFTDEAREHIDYLLSKSAYGRTEVDNAEEFKSRVEKAITGSLHIASEKTLETEVIDLHTNHGFTERGAALFVMNIDWESGWQTHVCGDHGKSCGLAQWQEFRRNRIAKQFGSFPEDLVGQKAALLWELKTHYPEAWEIYHDPNASDEDLRRAAYIFEGYGVEGQRWVLGVKLADLIGAANH